MDTDFDDFKGQVAGTIDFLKNKYSLLNELKEKITDLNWVIDCGYNTKVATGESAVESLHLPLELLKMCSDLQIGFLISLYDGNRFE